MFNPWSVVALFVLTIMALIIGSVGLILPMVDENNDAVTESQVLASVKGVYASVVAATTTPILTDSLGPGLPGMRMNITTPLIIDGVTVLEGERILVKDETDTTRNGVYTLAGSELVRSTDMNSSQRFVSGNFVKIEKGGLVNGGSTYTMYLEPSGGVRNDVTGFGVTFSNEAKDILDVEDVENGMFATSDNTRVRGFKWSTPFPAEADGYLYNDGAGTKAWQHPLPQTGIGTLNRDETGNLSWISSGAADAAAGNFGEIQFSTGSMLAAHANLKFTGNNLLTLVGTLNATTEVQTAKVTIGASNWNGTALNGFTSVTSGRFTDGTAAWEASALSGFTSASLGAITGTSGTFSSVSSSGLVTGSDMTASGTITAPTYENSTSNWNGTVLNGFTSVTSGRFTDGSAVWEASALSGFTSASLGAIIGISGTFASVSSSGLVAGMNMTASGTITAPTYENGTSTWAGTELTGMTTIVSDRFEQGTSYWEDRNLMNFYNIEGTTVTATQLRTASGRSYFAHNGMIWAEQLVLGGTSYLNTSGHTVTIHEDGWMKVDDYYQVVGGGKLDESLTGVTDVTATGTVTGSTITNGTITLSGSIISGIGTFSASTLQAGGTSAWSGDDFSNVGTFGVTTVNAANLNGTIIKAGGTSSWTGEDLVDLDTVKSKSFQITGGVSSTVPMYKTGPSGAPEDSGLGYFGGVSLMYDNIIRLRIQSTATEFIGTADGFSYKDLKIVHRLNNDSGANDRYLLFQTEFGSSTTSSSLRYKPMAWKLITNHDSVLTDVFEVNFEYDYVRTPRLRIERESASGSVPSPDIKFPNGHRFVSATNNLSYYHENSSNGYFPHSIYQSTGVQYGAFAEEDLNGIDMRVYWEHIHPVTETSGNGSLYNDTSFPDHETFSTVTYFSKATGEYQSRDQVYRDVSGTDTVITHMTRTYFGAYRFRGISRGSVSNPSFYMRATDGYECGLSMHQDNSGTISGTNYEVYGMDTSFDDIRTLRSGRYRTTSSGGFNSFTHVSGLLDVGGNDYYRGECTAANSGTDPRMSFLNIYAAATSANGNVERCDSYIQCGRHQSDTGASLWLTRFYGGDLKRIVLRAERTVFWGSAIPSAHNTYDLGANDSFNEQVIPGRDGNTFPNGLFFREAFITTVTNSSDIRIKENIEDINHGMDLIREIRAVSYKFKDKVTRDPDGNEIQHTYTRRHYGFIADNVIDFFREREEDSALFVDPSYNGGQGLKALRYVQFIPVIFKGMNELDDEIEATKENVTQESFKIQANFDRLQVVDERSALHTVQVESIVSTNSEQHERLEELERLAAKQTADIARLESQIANLLGQLE